VAEDQAKPLIEIADAPHPLMHPALRLFLSADIVGSTPLKQPFDINEEDPERQRTYSVWRDIIQLFYETISDEFIKKAWLLCATEDATKIFNVSPEEISEETFLGPAPEVWKTIGDEVIFVKEITSDVQIWFVLAAWLRAVEFTRDRLEEEQSDTGAVLDLKLTAWLASFPVRNAILFDPFKQTKGKYHVQDYIGPGIDVGFRIAKWASASKFSVSLDVAYFLSATHSNSEECGELIKKMRNSKRYRIKGGLYLDGEYKALNLRFGGTDYLQGVLGGTKYPFFYIESLRSGSLDDFERDIVNYPPKQTDWSKIRQYCEKYYGEREKYLFKPFLNKENSRIFRENIPDNYKNFYQALISNWD